MTMSALQPLNKGVAEVTINVKDFIVHAYTFVKDKIVALAQIVFSFLKDTVWPFVTNLASQTWTFLRTPAGLITVGAAVGLLLADLSSKVDRNEQPLLKDALLVSSLAAFIGAGVAVGLGVAYGFSAVLIGA